MSRAVPYSGAEVTPTRGGRKILSMVVAIALAIGGLIVGATPSYATQGIRSSVIVDGSKYNDTQVVQAGQTLELKVQYDKTVTPGSTVKIALGPDVTLAALPGTNTAVTSVTRNPANANEVLITFADPLPSNIDQGVLGFKFTVNEVEKSGYDKITWSVDGEPTSLDVIVRNPGDSFENVSNWVNKGNGGVDWGGAVKVDAQGKVTLDQSALDKVITYTLNVNSTTAVDGYQIADELAPELAYVSGSFKASQTTWDAQGLNKTTSDVTFAPAVDGNSFTGSLNIPAKSQTTITYQAKLAGAEALKAIEQQLQAKYDAIGEDGGSYTVQLGNTVLLQTEKKESRVSIGGNVPAPAKPDVGKAFKKGSDWDTTFASPAADGSLTPPVDVTYTLGIDLSTFDGANKYKQLSSNVIVTDTLPVQATWKTADSAFLTAEGLELSKAEPIPADAEAFAADAYVGTYYVDGQTLHINVGKDQKTAVTVKVKAQVTTVRDLGAGQTNLPGAKAYKLPNRAVFSYTTGDGAKTESRTKDVTLIDRGDGSDGYNDPNTFKKTATPQKVTVKPDEPVTVKYDFTIGAGKGIDLTKSRIVDYVDTNLFDISDLTAIEVTGKYDRGRDLVGSDFTLSKNAAGNLVIGLSDTGKAKLAEWGTDKQAVISFELTTKPLVGTQSVTITNKATLFGEDNKPKNWSEITTDATSYGDEAEVRKTVRDSKNQAWTQNLRADVSEDGKLVQTDYVYNVALIPHGGYQGVEIIDVADQLPKGVEFLGFVNSDKVDSQENPVKDPIDLRGNIQARFDAATTDAPSGTVVMFQKPGTTLSANPGDVSVNILVRITDFKVDTPIMNVIGGTHADITPSDGYPLSISKKDAKDQTKVISDPTSVFQILDADGKVVVEKAFVENGQLRVTQDGESKAVKVAEPGTYTVKEIKAPAGYAQTDATVKVTVGDDGSSEAVTFYNEPAPTPKTYAVGDFVWIDGNKDGLQDDSEVLAGVEVTLLDKDGNLVKETVTDVDGRYLFDELAAGEYQVKFELTAEQAAKYEFTKRDAGDDAKDSDADPSTGLTVRFTLDDSNEALTKEYKDQSVKATEGIDPTWDAGVVLKPEPVKTYAVGDFVWVDGNKDGLQGDSEVLAGVKVTLLDKDGKQLKETVTDVDGRYLFDELAAGEYQVKFELTAEQAAKYEFTKRDAGDDAKDSDADPSTGLTVRFTLDDSNEALTKEYADQSVKATEGIDPTWDAGVIVKSTPTPPIATPTPSTPVPTTPAPTPSAPTSPVPTPTPSVPSAPKPKPGVPSTGSDGDMGAIGGIALIGLVSMALVARRMGGKH